MLFLYLLRRQREEYEKFSKAAELLTQNERNQVYGFGRSEGSRASWAARKAQAAAPAVNPSGSSGGSAVTVSVPGGSNGGSGKVYSGLV